MSCFAAGAAVGPLVGGALLEHFWWGSAFLLNVPVMAVLLVGGAAVLPAPPARRRAQLDLRGAVMSLVAILLVTYVLKTAVSEGLDVVAVVSLAAGAAVGGAFIRQQKTASHPLVDLSLFRTSGFAVCLVATVLSAFVVAGCCSTWPNCCNWWRNEDHLRLVCGRFQSWSRRLPDRCRRPRSSNG
jgi:DHA2 family multidrug resistance protein-like MFS transporter